MEIKLSPDELKKFLKETGIPGSTQFKYYAHFKNSNLKFIKRRIIKLIELSKTSRTGITLKRNILLYGREEGLKRWNSYRERQAYTNSREYKNMSEDEFKEYNDSRAVTLKNMIKRWGEEEGAKKFSNYCKKQSYTKSIDYYIEQFGEVEGPKKFNEVNLKKAQTLENMVKKYGQEEGLQRYHDYKNKLKIFHSKEASDIFEELDKEFKTLEFLPKTREFSIANRFFDCYHRESNTVIEYNGDIWHANPKKFKDKFEFEKKYQSFNLNYDYIRGVNFQKEKLVESEGARLIILWESYYKTHKSTIIKELSELLKSKFTGKVELI